MSFHVDNKMCTKWRNKTKQGNLVALKFSPSGLLHIHKIKLTGPTLVSSDMQSFKNRAVKVNALIYEINAIKYFHAVNATLFTSGVR